MSASSSRLGLLCGMLALSAMGCASGPYRYGRGWNYDPTAHSPAPQDYRRVEVVEGRPNRYIDGAGWVLGINAKLLLWDRRASNHNVTPQTTGAVVNYLEQNGMTDVCVRVNQYDPAGEWRRLRENDEIPAGWRYTFGTMSVVQYALFPGRLTGRDKYNPYTNSVYLFSDIPSLGIQSAAYAKDIRQRDYPGSYATVNQFPVVSLWHETIATDDSLRYFATTGTPQEQEESRKILYPHYGMCVGGAVDNFIGLGPVFEIGGAIAGHMTNRYQAPSSSAQPSQPTLPPSPSAEDVANDPSNSVVSPTGG